MRRASLNDVRDVINARARELDTYVVDFALEQPNDTTLRMLFRCASGALFSIDLDLPTLLERLVRVH